MTEINDNLNQLLEKLEILLKRQNSFLNEINELRDEINRLKNVQPFESEIKEELQTTPLVVIVEQEVKKENIIQDNKSQPVFKAADSVKPPKRKSDIEKFIGENLINKIGIAITVIGVAIGAKYSIEHQLISPLTRIILGYLMGLGLLGFGIKLKRDYENYSAVLVSGAMAIMFFITFSAYSFYNLIPQVFTFSLMVVFTSFTVLAAIYYNRQVIAHIGLVGAYAVPFLLSDGSGKVVVLFSYMAIINIGILFIAFKKYWKPLYYSSFILTWLIFSSWFATRFQVSQHFVLSLAFLSVFFATFYAIFLSYKLLRKEKFEIWDIILLLANSFIFYSSGYAILSKHFTGEQLLGLFTLGNAIIHFVVSLIIYRNKLADRNLFFMVAGLVLVFITIAIPVQLDGNWVTLLWVSEAALMFWIGRAKKVTVYEILSYALMVLSFCSIVHDWQLTYHFYVPFLSYSRITPVLNVNFLSSVIFIIIFVLINYMNRSQKFSSSFPEQKSLISVVNFVIPAILITVIYFGIRMEISNYWNLLYADSAVEIKNTSDVYPDTFWNYDLMRFKTVWLLNYTFLFFSALTFVNVKKIKSAILGYISTGLNAFMMLVFLTVGLYIISELRESYLNQTLAVYYHNSMFNIVIRYVSFFFVGLVLYTIYMFVTLELVRNVSKGLKIAFDFLLYASVLWIASSELINWMDIMHFTQSYKLGLSILWGVYALLLIVLGIWKNKKYIRISAISLFGVTLVKLFVYDISHLDTIAKTIVFVSLGILLLIISFLYNKYKKIIF